MLLPLALRSSGVSVRKAIATAPLPIWLSTKRIGLLAVSCGPAASAAMAGAAAVAASVRAVAAARTREEEEVMGPMVVARPPRAHPPQVCAFATYDVLERSQMLIPDSTA